LKASEGQRLGRPSLPRITGRIRDNGPGLGFKVQPQSCFQSHGQARVWGKRRPGLPLFLHLRHPALAGLSTYLYNALVPDKLLVWVGAAFEYLRDFL